MQETVSSERSSLHKKDDRLNLIQSVIFFYLVCFICNIRQDLLLDLCQMAGHFQMPDLNQMLGLSQMPD